MRPTHSVRRSFFDAIINRRLHYILLFFYLRSLIAPLLRKLLTMNNMTIHIFESLSHINRIIKKQALPAGWYIPVPTHPWLPGRLRYVNSLVERPRHKSRLVMTHKSFTEGTWRHIPGPPMKDAIWLDEQPAHPSLVYALLYNGKLIFDL